MEAGRELDALVAEKVLGWTEQIFYSKWAAPKKVWRKERDGVVEQDMWEPSTSIADAWTVVERIRELGWIGQVGIDPEYPEQWWADFTREPYNENHVWSYSATAPLAICRAALYALDALPLPAYDSPERWGKR